MEGRAIETNQRPVLVKKLSVIDETLQMELERTKKKLNKITNQNTVLMSQVFNLTRLMKRIAYEEDLNIRRMEAKIEDKDEQINELRYVLKVVEQNSKWFDNCSDFWDKVVNNEDDSDVKEEKKKKEGNKDKTQEKKG
jgi:hypothetical protein